MRHPRSPSCPSNVVLSTRIEHHSLNWLALSLARHRASRRGRGLVASAMHRARLMSVDQSGETSCAAQGGILHCTPNPLRHWHGHNYIFDVHWTRTPEHFQISCRCAHGIVVSERQFLRLNRCALRSMDCDTSSADVMLICLLTARRKSSILVAGGSRHNHTIDRLPTVHPQR
ncbi:hypothetical protein DL93DRAFT_486099 [Clavulina sp. PMI_390]|nr:hypothetical protein DL93DRAFT_486099 [Clavulina sp. PMI_390]